MTDLPAIEVRYEAVDPAEIEELPEGRAMLTWRERPLQGRGWTLWYWRSGHAEDAFFQGDLTDVDRALTQARDWLKIIKSQT